MDQSKKSVNDVSISQKKQNQYVRINKKIKIINLLSIQQDLYDTHFQHFMYQMFNQQDTYNQQNILDYFDKILQYFILEGFTPIIMEQILLQQQEFFILHFDQLQRMIVVQQNQNKINSVQDSLFKNRSISIIGLLGNDSDNKTFQQYIQALQNTKYDRQIEQLKIQYKKQQYINNNYKQQKYHLLFPHKDISQVSTFKTDEFKTSIISKFYNYIVNSNEVFLLSQKINNKQLEQQYSQKQFYKHNIPEVPIQTEENFQKFLKPIFKKFNLQLFSKLQINQLLENVGLLLDYLIFLDNPQQYQGTIKSIKTNIINRTFQLFLNNTDTYELRLLQMIYINLYGYNPKVMNVKTKTDFFLIIPVDKVFVFEKQLEIYLKTKQQSVKCYHNSICMKLLDKQTTNDKKYQTLCELLQDFATKLSKEQEHIQISKENKNNTTINTSDQILVQSVGHSSQQHKSVQLQSDMVEKEGDILKIPISFIMCKKCDSEIICGHQALQIFLYDKKELFDEFIQKFTILSNNISSTQYCCKFCGELLQDSIQVMQIENIDTSKKYISFHSIFRNVYQRVQFQTVFNVQNIFKDMVLATYHYTKQELIQYKQAIDYKQRKLIIQLIFVCSYFRDINGKNVIVDFQKIFQLYQKDLPFKLDVFIDLIEKTHSKYKIKSLIFTQPQNVYETIYILLQNKPVIQNHFEEIYNLIIKSKQQDVKIDLREFYQIEKYKKYFNKSVFEVDRDIIQQVLIAQAMEQYQIQATDNKQSKFVETYVQQKRQIAISQSHFIYHTPNNNVLSKYQTNLFIPLLSVSEKDFNTVNSQFYPIKFYQQFCHQLISGHLNNKPIKHNKEHILNKTKDEEINIEIENRTITMSATKNKKIQKSLQSNQIQRTKQQLELSISYFEHKFIGEQCKMCGFNQKKENDIIYKPQEFISQFFFIYNKCIQNNNAKQQDYRNNNEYNNDTKQFEYVHQQLKQFCIKNNIPLMKIINLGGFDYVDYNQIIQMSSLESVVKQQLFNYKNRYISFMKKRNGNDKCTDIPADLFFITQQQFDWSLYKNRFHKVSDYFKHIIIKLTYTTQNIEVLNQLNNKIEQMQQVQCKNYYVLTQCLIYQFFTELIQTLIQNNGNDQVMDCLQSILQIDEQFAAKDFAGALYQKQKTRQQVISIDEEYQEEQDFDEIEQTKYIEEPGEYDYDKDLLNIKNNNDQDTEDEDRVD